MQLTLLQPSWISDNPPPADSEFSHTCLNPVISLPSYAVFTDSRSRNVLTRSFSHSKNSDNHAASISAQTHLCSASSQHSLFISGHSGPSACIIFSKNHRPFLLICFTSSLEPTFNFSPTTLCQSLRLWHSTSYICLFLFLHGFINFTIHNSLTVLL